MVCEYLPHVYFSEGILRVQVDTWNKSAKVQPLSNECPPGLWAVLNSVLPESIEKPDIICRIYSVEEHDFTPFN